MIESKVFSMPFLKYERYQNVKVLREKWRKGGKSDGTKTIVYFHLDSPKTPHEKQKCFYSVRNPTR